LTKVAQGDTMSKQIFLECLKCGQRVPYIKPKHTCEKCGNDWLEARYNLQEVKKSFLDSIARRPFNMWRYFDLLPLHDEANIVTMGEGGTPLLRAENLALMLGSQNIYIKDERQSPTGSFKDRQGSLAISVLREAEITEGVLASTGNVAISYSAYSSRAGIKMWTFLTSLVPAAKMYEVALYGSEVIKVTGTYDQARALAAQFAEHKGYFLDRGVRSIAAKESMKTVAFEIAEQLGWRAPDWYVQSVSGGLGPLGVWKGFHELKEMGLVDKVPALACIQTAGCAPMVNSFKKGLENAEPVLHPQTRIETLATGNPGYTYNVIRQAILADGGIMESASDEESFRAMHVLAKMDGISMEPAAAVAFAGLFKLLGQGTISRDDLVVVNCSGHTLSVEKEILGESREHSLEIPRPTKTHLMPPPQEGLLAALERLDDRVQSVLIVEDSPDARRLVRRILQARGKYQIREATGGREALEMARAAPPDLVILDLMMPEVDGFAVLEALKEEKELADLPVIVVTAKELTELERQRLSGHIEALLQKGSFMDEDLLKDIAEALPLTS
jgi:threonine synthase